MLLRYLTFFCNFTFCSDNGLANDFHKLFTFVQKVAHFVFWKQISFDDESKPKSDFSKFFQTNRQLMDKIGSAFGGSSFFIIRRGGRPASHKLTGDMPSQSRIRQGIDNFSDPHRKLQ